jgi:uncharacterized coiled-coil protein SlyX
MASNIGSPAAPKMVDLSGFAYNRPLAGGEVWLDVNDNQQIDAADYRVPGKVDSKGEYRGQVPETLASLPVMVDTTTTEYRGQLPDVLLAPEGSRVVSPFTHGLATGAITRDDIPGNFNPLTDNPYAETQNPEQQAANAIVQAALPDIGRSLARNSAAIANNQQSIQQLRDELQQLRSAFEAFRNQLQEPEPIIPAAPPSSSGHCIVCLPYSGLLYLLKKLFASLAQAVHAATNRIRAISKAQTRNSVNLRVIKTFT